MSPLDPFEPRTRPLPAGFAATPKSLHTLIQHVDLPSGELQSDQLRWIRRRLASAKLQSRLDRREKPPSGTHGQRAIEESGLMLESPMRPLGPISAERPGRHRRGRMLVSSLSTKKNDRWEQELTGGLKPIAQPQPTGRTHHSRLARMSISRTPFFGFGTPQPRADAVTSCAFRAHVISKQRRKREQTRLVPTCTLRVASGRSSSRSAPNLLPGLRISTGWLRSRVPALESSLRPCTGP